MQTAATSSTSRQPPPPMSVSMMSGTTVGERSDSHNIVGFAVFEIASIADLREKKTNFDFASYILAVTLRA